MEDVSGMGIGDGLAALAFWGFIAAIVLGGIWSSIRKREAQHETVRRIIESGQQIDQEVFDKLLSVSDGSSTRVDRYFQLTGLVLIPFAIGMAALGVLIGLQYDGYLGPLLGVAALLACLAGGFLLIGKITSSWYQDASSSEQTAQG
jgi:hypothetical protein